MLKDQVITYVTYVITSSTEKKKTLAFFVATSNKCLTSNSHSLLVTEDTSN